jgi:TolB protein
MTSKNLLTKPLLILLIAFGVSRLPAQTEVRLRAETKTFVRLQIELKPCLTHEQATAEMGRRVVDILDNDLWMSSTIAAFQTEEGLANHDTLRPEAALLRPTGPLRLSVQTHLTLRQKKIVLEAELIDSAARKTLERKSYRGCPENLRLLVHSLADDLVRSLTGERGIAKSRIAFTASSSGSKELYAMDYDGANQDQITNLRTLNVTPSWSADGRTLVFTSYLRSNPDLYALDLLSKKNAPLLRGNGLYSGPAYSPDGKKIAFVTTKDGNAEIYVMEANGKHLQRLTQNPAIDSSPSWSPTGREMVFTSDRLGNPQLFIMDAEGSNVRRLPVEGNYHDSPVWSPRGDKIAFVSRLDFGFDIFTFDVTSETTTRLTADAGSNEDPSWSPDGYRLVFSSTRNGRHDIYTMMWDGTDVRRLTFKGTCTSPSWSLNVRPEEEYDCSQ